MTDNKKLAEDIGNVFSNIAKRQNIYDWLSQQPLSHDWKKEDIQNCKPEYVAVLTKEEREFLLKDCEDSLRYKYKNDETEKKNNPIATAVFILMEICFAVNAVVIFRL